MQDSTVTRWLNEQARDVRYGVPVASAAPGFTATVVLSARPRDRREHRDLQHSARARAAKPACHRSRSAGRRDQRTRSALPYPLFRHFRERSQTLDGVLAFRTAPMRLEVDGVTERVTGALVSGSYFDVLGVQPALGTAIAEADDVTPGPADPVVRSRC